jgi:hypothetical protein
MAFLASSSLDMSLRLVPTGDDTTAGADMAVGRLGLPIIVDWLVVTWRTLIDAQSASNQRYVSQPLKFKPIYFLLFELSKLQKYISNLIFIHL